MSNVDQRPIILTGDRPTGQLHLGHFVGSLRNRVKYQHQYQQYIMLADAQALTDNMDNPAKVHDNVLEVALDYLAVGIDPTKSTIFIQSQIPELTELTFYYLNLVSVARLERNPTIKQEIILRNFERDIPAGLVQEPVDERDCRVLARLLGEYNEKFVEEIGGPVVATGEGFFRLRPANSRPYASMYAN